jgi:hypothetical protein
MSLVVTNFGRDLGVIPDNVFCMLTLMMLITTLITMPLVSRFMRGTELEPHIRKSAFHGKASGGG